MLETLFYLFLIIAMLLTLVSIFIDVVFWKLTLVLVSITLWFTLSFGVMELEKPYVYWNTTTNIAESGIHTFSPESSIYVSPFFMLMAVLMMIYFIYVLFYETLGSQGKKFKRPRRW